MKENKTEKVKDVLKDLIEKGLKLKTTRASLDANIIHVTDIYEFCGKRLALALKHKIPLRGGENHPFYVKLTFSIGYQIESVILKSINDFLVGSINVCQSCGKVIYDAPVLKYKVGDCSIIGHPDAVIELEGNRYIIDVKSIDGDKFNSLEEPPFRNEHQVMCYLYLSKKLRLGYANTGFLIYVSKKQSQNPIKIFPVKMTKPFKEDMKSIIDGIESAQRGEIPDGVCNSILYPLYRDCPVNYLCLGGNNEKNCKKK